MLGTTIREVVVSVKDFPFPASVLKERISYLLDGMYLFDSLSYTKHIFNQEYSVNVTDITSNGGRFSEKETEIIF